MPRRRRDGSAVRPGVIASHPIVSVDPVLADLVGEGLIRSVLPSTRSSYETGAVSWINFCDARGLVPWPVDAVWFVAWMRRQAMLVSVPSLRMYMAGIRYFQEMEGHEWGLRENQLVRRMMRFLKRRYPSKDKADKVPITTALLRRLLVLLPGWPVLGEMSANDRSFAVASVIGVAGFLWGGEFLAGNQSGRRVLLRKMVTVRDISGGRAVVVSVPQPKTRWWLEKVEVPCCERKGDPEWCPVKMWSSYENLRGGRGSVSVAEPAFVLEDGGPVTRDFMVAKTAELMARAGIEFVDTAGKPMPVKMASWRAGAVRSAVDAGVGEATIRALGRWQSSAWMSYLLHSLWDVQGAARSMWSTELSVGSGTHGLRVGRCDIGACFTLDRAEEGRALERHRGEVIVMEGAHRQAGAPQGSGLPRRGLRVASG